MSEAIYTARQMMTPIIIAIATIVIAMVGYTYVIGSLYDELGRFEDVESGVKDCTRHGYGTAVALDGDKYVTRCFRVVGG